MRGTRSRHCSASRCCAGETENRIVVSNISEKIGESSDPEDLRVMVTGQAVVLREGNNLDVTLPIVNKAGTVIAGAGITLADDGTKGEDALMKQAEAIARELTAEVQAAKRVLW